MKILKKNIIIVILMTAIVFISGVITLNYSIDSATEDVSNDNDMVTNYYKSDIIINNDNTYTINETINVSFLSPKHGIYRYIPYLGQINRVDSEGYFEKIPYYSNIDIIDCKDNIHSVDNENGNKCIVIGDEDTTLTGNKEYSIQYKLTPKAQGGYTTIYYNIFPTYWQNQIPSESEFSITFPKEVPKNMINLFYGKYGQNYNASNIIDFKWDGNTLNGTLKQSLPLGSGLTIYAPVGSDYFANVNTINNELYVYITVCICICITVAFLYFKFGKDEKIVPTIQFNPPKDLDSAAAGFIVDGYADDEDIISLLIYLAHKGYLKINKKSKKDLEFIKVRNLTGEEPAYIKVIFEGIFGKEGKKGNTVSLSSLKYEFEPALSAAKSELSDIYEDDIYTKYSKISRRISAGLCVLPLAAFIIINTVMSYTTVNSAFIYIVLELIFGIGIIVLCNTCDSYYSIKKTSRIFSLILGGLLSISSIILISYYYFIRTVDRVAFKWYISLSVMIISTVIVSIFTIFMKKRSHECVEIMNYLVGFKDFIENAELDKIKYLAEENPQWFYDVLPYAYVFGISDIWIKKFKDITLRKPEWYNGYDNGDYSFMAFNTMIMHDLNRVHSVCTSVQPSNNSSSGSSWGGGSSGGGFSGGGFGGGGGGSW